MGQLGRAINRIAVRTGSVDEAQERLSNSYLPLTLRAPMRRTAIDAQLTTAQIGRVTVGSIRFGAAMRIVTGEAFNFHVNIPVAGRCVSHDGTAGETVTEPGWAQVFMPGAPADLDWTADTQQICLMVDTAATERELAGLLGDDVAAPLVFDHKMDVRRQESPWASVIRLLDHQVRHDSGLLNHPLTRQTLERLVIQTLLTTHRHNYSTALSTGAQCGGARQIQEVVEMIAVRPEHPWTAGEIARHAGISVRALHTGFRTRMGVTPMAYVRDTRLDRVHVELVDAHPTTTVTDIARRWGFVHLGRFASAYERRFGELPSTTLRKGR